MKDILEKLIHPAGGEEPAPASLPAEERMRRQVAALFQLLVTLHGPERLVLKASKLEAIPLMRSDSLEDHVLALLRIVQEDPTAAPPASPEDVVETINALEDELSDRVARRSVEEQIEKKVQDRMQQRHEEYVKEIKQQVLKEDAGPETAQSLRKLEELERLDQVKLALSATQVLRPASLTEVVGQEQAVRALLAKLASPFPQHILLYGPPGIGKTTVARLALQEALKLRHTPFQEGAPFIEVDGTTLRWDPREVTNPLLGSVHDPIYQGARRDLADGGVPEPKPGLVTEAHGGVLFLDEIGELDPMLQNKLLKVLEDKRVKFDSSYFDPNDENVPQYIRKLFAEGAPADFVLIGATTRDPADVNPALRSRCAEVFFEPLTPVDITRIVEQSSHKLGVDLEAGVAEVIAEYTIEGRKAVGILADAYGTALYENGGLPEPGAPRLQIGMRHIQTVIQSARLSPNVQQKGSSTVEAGRIFGLGVSGYVGSVLEIEAIAFPARVQGKGALRFNETAGAMTKDSVFNAASVIRRATGEDLADWDLHVNVVGGGRIDGPSAGVAIYLAMISAIRNLPIWQDVAITGEVSIRGKVKAIGGVYEKIYGAKQAGMKRVILPAENQKDAPEQVKGIELIFVHDIAEAMAAVFAGEAPTAAVS